ncbi:hypothetical protein Zmor_014345 [Zophobas morio]|uniref:DUF4817 domain-containing protein n=1 Tax=Zophobas morio TaxID=2755281 RepID=A0AA38MGD1_9CUCU|nr:hypothetical protein Zmor_014345 [Zophobas morio]
MVDFLSAGMTDMVLMYGQALGNSLGAQRLYHETFPERRLPNHKTFAAVLYAEEEILNAVEENRGINVRRLSYRIGVSPFVVWRTLHKQGLFPYRVQRVQHLKPEDFARRVHFCEWLCAKNREDPQFVTILLSTDEATFTKNGVFNLHNTHLWCAGNPHAIQERNFQDRWVGIVGNQLIGP